MHGIDANADAFIRAMDHRESIYRETDMASGLCKRCNMLQARPGSTLCINCLQARKDIVATTVGTVVILAFIVGVIILFAGCATTPNVRFLDADGVQVVIDSIERHIDDTAQGGTAQLVAALGIGLATYVGNQVRKARRK